MNDMITRPRRLDHTQKPPFRGMRQIDQRAVLLAKHFDSGIVGNPLVEVVGAFDASKKKISCKSGDGKLLAAAVSRPTYLDWAKPLNNKEKEYAGNKPDRMKAVVEHELFLQILISYGVELTLIESALTRPEAVYTCDIGFAVGSKFFRANLVEKARSGEHEMIIHAIVPPKEVKIEGGNVLLDDKAVFVGIGDRTTPNAVEWLQHELGTSYEVVGLRLKKGILHLDCAFYPIDEKKGKAFIYYQAFEKGADLEKLHKIYWNSMPVSKREFDNLGPNVLRLDKFTAIVNPNAFNIAKQLLALGIKVIMLPYDELIKGGGSYRCTYLAYHRKD